MNVRTLAAATVASLCFAACSEFDPVEDTSWNYSDEEESIINSFNENFVLRYGAIDPVHTWGFEELSAEPAEMKTRTVDANRNLWTASVRDNGGVIVEYVTTTPRQDPWNANNFIWEIGEGGLVVPGFPSVVDGKYYVEGGTQDEIAVYDSKEALIAAGKATDKGSFTPVGDVTQEEILYVSNWFRSHPNPGSIEVELTDFFIQDISQDKDRLEYPDGPYDPAKTTQVPVYNSEGKQEGYSNVAYGMDYFSVHTSADELEHIKNFNKSKANLISEADPNSTSQPLNNRTIMWWNTNGGVTTDFSYHNSDDDKTHDKYVLVYLSFEGPQTGLHYEGYYLAFDYELSKTDGAGKTTKIEPDGYYSNWIVKLSPGKNIPEPPTGNETKTVRVMCEDLGNTYDFDFNDLVFDVSYTYDEKDGVKSNIKAHITVQAAGGTLPIYIGNVTEEREAHHILGATTTSTPINVGNGDTRNPATLVIDAKSTNPDEIEIYVEGITATTTITLLPQSSTPSNRAPQKIATETTTKWLKERQQIEWGYPKFDDWVNEQTDDWTTEKVGGYLY